MLDVIMSEYQDYNIYSPITTEPAMVYIETTDENNEGEWDACPVVNIVNRANYDEPDDYEKAVDELINKAHGITGEIINDDYSIYIEADHEHSVRLPEEPQISIVRYC